VSVHVENLPQDPKYRQTPHQRKQRPAPETAQVDQSKRRVRPGNKQVDRCVIQGLEDSLPTWGSKAVIHRRCRVEQHQRYSKCRAPGYVTGFAANNEKENEPRKPYDAQNETDPVVDSVRQLLEPFFVVIHVARRTSCPSSTTWFVFQLTL